MGLFSRHLRLLFLVTALVVAAFSTGIEELFFLVYLTGAILIGSWLYARRGLRGVRADYRVLNPRTHVVRHGVDFDHFRAALDPATQIPAEIANLPRPVLGFFGLVADWVDIDLMAEMARRFNRGLQRCRASSPRRVGSQRPH